MRLLADENLPRSTIEALRQDGDDVFCVRTDAPGTKDSILLERAEAEARLILTLDNDFWQIALQRPMPISQCGVILLRVNPAVADRLTPLARRVLKRGIEAWRGKITIATADNIHLVPAPGRS